MEQLSDLRLWVFFFVALVWAYRARRAAASLHALPVVDPAIRPGATEAPLVSVIIPAKNEEKNIRPCLEALLTQDYLRFEILVANDNSTDKTEILLQSFGNLIQSIPVPATPPGWTGENFALHTAVQKAKGQ